MNYIIISDSSSDIHQIKKASYTTVPLKISTDEKEFIDDKSLKVGKMVSYLKSYKGKSKTSCPNTQEWKDAFEDFDVIFCITITSQLSGSYNAAKIALDEHLKANPHKKGMVIDSLSTGPENALIIEKLITYIKDGLSFEEIKENILQYKSTTHLLFKLNSLTNLANNGRTSPTVAKLASLLNIRIIGKAGNQGTLEVISKVRGKERTISELFKQMRNNGYIGGKVRIHHCQNKTDAVALKNQINKIFPYTNVEIQETGGLCSFYAEIGGILVGYEGTKKTSESV